MLNSENTDFISFFVGLSHKELEELEILVQSFERNFSHKLVVMDMTRASLELVSRKERMWQQDRAFTYEIEPTITIEQVDSFFEKHKNCLIRIESDVYEMRSHRTNRVMYEVSNKQYVLLLDSDIEFTNGRFFEEMSDMMARSGEERIGMAGNYISAYDFGVDTKIYGSRRFNIFDSMLKFSDYLKTFANHLKFKFSRGIANSANFDKSGQRKKGMFPRIDPAFLLMNREEFVKHDMRFNLLYLDALNFEEGGDMVEWRVLGDESAGIVYEMAKNQIATIGVNYERWALHKGGSWQALKKKNDNWFYIGRDLECSNREFWKSNKMPAKMVYKRR